MKESIIFEGSAGDDINDVISIAINRANQLNKAIFIRWNGATVRVSPNSYKNKILFDYGIELKKIDLYNMREQGEVITKTELANKIASVITKFLINN